MLDPSFDPAEADRFKVTPAVRVFTGDELTLSPGGPPRTVTKVETITRIWLDPVDGPTPDPAYVDRPIGGHVMARRPAHLRTIRPRIVP